MWGIAPNWAGDEPKGKRRRVGFTEGEPDAPRAYHLSNPDFWLSTVSSTFHGRDIFAPVAAHLASGAHPDRVGQRIPLESLVMLPIGAPRVQRSGKSATVVGQIVHCDRFGNIITNLPERLLAPLLVDSSRTVVEVAGHSINSISTSYSDVGEGEPVAMFGSERLLEVAVRNANAAHRMKVRVGDPVRIIIARNEA
jgi:S-adenosylmethionine hydrolase